MGHINSGTDRDDQRYPWQHVGTSSHGPFSLSAIFTVTDSLGERIPLANISAAIFHLINASCIIYSETRKTLFPKSCENFTVDISKVSIYS